MWNLQHNFLGEEWPSWKHILKQKSQNVSIAPMNQIVHTFKVKRKFPFTQHQRLCKFFDLWASLFLQNHSSSRKSFQKLHLLKFLTMNLLFLLVAQKDVESPSWETKTTLAPKGDIPFSSSSLSTHSTTPFPDRGALSQRNACAATVSFPIVETEWCFKGALRCEVVARACTCEIHFPYS